MGHSRNNKRIGLLISLLLCACMTIGAAASETTRIGLPGMFGDLDISSLVDMLSSAGSSSSSSQSSTAGSLSDLGSLLQMLGVTSREIKDCKIGSISDQTYTGKAITPTPVITYNGDRLKKGTDYKITYSDNTKVGTAKAKITGIGNYTGTKTVSFKIVRKNASSGSSSGQKGSSSKNNSSSSTSKKKHFTVKLSRTSYTYSGKVCKPTVTVTVNGKKIDSKDYTVSYKDHKNVGRATVTVKGKNAYKGYSGESTFKITLKKTSLTSASSPSAGTIKAGWKKDSQADGYQLQCATNKTFSSNVKKVTVKENTGTTLSRTIEKLTSGKKYYVQIRSFKKVGSTNWYSEWSAARTVSVK